jgi:hypothetical protein
MNRNSSTHFLKIFSFEYLILGQKSCFLGPNLKFHNRTDITPHLSFCVTNYREYFLQGRTMGEIIGDDPNIEGTVYILGQ